MKKRIIPCIFLKEGMIVRSEGFSKHQIIGNPVNQVSRFSDWAVDEIVYILTYLGLINTIIVGAIIKLKFQMINLL